jgi:DNA topoisomerase IB
VKVDGETITFDYTAKSGKRRIQSVADPAVVGIVAALKARSGGGHELLAWYDDERERWCDVKSADINAYLKEVMGGDFSAKDFRTWSATVLASVALAVSGPAQGSKTSRKRAINRAVKETAHYLGNTPAVCRSSYVAPRVVDRYTAGATVLDALASLDEESGLGGLHTHGAIEEAVLDLLTDESVADAAARVAAAA